MLSSPLNSPPLPISISQKVSQLELDLEEAKRTLEKERSQNEELESTYIAIQDELESQVKELKEDKELNERKLTLAQSQTKKTEGLVDSLTEVNKAAVETIDGLEVRRSGWGWRVKLRSDRDPPPRPLCRQS